MSSRSQKGLYGNHIGWFPSNYTIEEIEDAVHTYARAENVVDIVVALYSFTAQNEVELSFRKGEKLEIIDRPASDPDWYKARNAAGDVGLVPKNYLQVSLCCVFLLVSLITDVIC